MSEIVIDYATFPVAERDQALGAYMESWNRVERALFAFVLLFSGAEFTVARAVFANSKGVAQLRELILALGQLRLSAENYRELGRVLDKVKDYSTKRNRIVHGDWVAHYDSKTAPTRFDHWTRHYHAPDHETFMGGLTGDDQKVAANFSFTVHKIQELTVANCALAARMEAFRLGLKQAQP